MPVTRAQVGELVANVFDRLESQLGEGVTIEDALLLVELSDPNDTVVDEGKERPATMVIAECTSDRVIIQMGIIQFAAENLGAAEATDDDD